MGYFNKSKLLQCEITNAHNKNKLVQSAPWRY